MNQCKGRQILVESVVLTAMVENGRFVDMAAGAASAAGARADGPVLMRGDSGDAVPACTIGTAQAVAGGAVAAGAQLEVGTDGKVVTKSTGVVVAKARESAAADGDEIEVFVMAN